MGPNGDGAQPAIVPPQPVPQTVQVQQVPGPDAKLYARLVFSGPTGVYYAYLTGEEADLIGRALLEVAGPTKAGLTVARPHEV